MTEKIARIIEEAELISDFELGHRIFQSGILEVCEFSQFPASTIQTMVF